MVRRDRLRRWVRGRREGVWLAQSRRPALGCRLAVGNVCVSKLELPDRDSCNGGKTPWGARVPVV